MSALFSRLSKEKQIKLAFWKVKDELNEHLDTINQNTDEISETFEAIARLEEKIDRIEMRLERIEVEKSLAKAPDMITLSLREQELFAVLYGSERRMALREIADRLSLEQDIVTTLLANLVAKGIPVLRQTTNDSILIYLDRQFRERHAKSPAVTISEQVLQSVNSEKDLL